jgi:hypothetical protein
VIWPGFSWYNLYYPDEVKNKRPRRGGNFFWTQASRVISGNAKSIYIAMFDEVDESTAMYKLAENDDQTPDQAYFLALDADGYNLPSDWYLRCAKLATEIVRGNTDNRTTLGTPPDGIDQFSARPIAARCGETNGKLILKYPLSDADHLYEFSIDGSSSYPYISPVGSSEISIQGLSAGIYNVWVRNEDDSNPVDLGPYTIFDTAPFASLSPMDATCVADGKIIFLIKDLPYAGEVEISIDSGMNYIYISSPGIWKDTIGGLLPGDYPVWIRYDDGTCPVELVKVSISTSIEPIKIYPMLDGEQITGHPDTLYACPGSSLILSCLPTNSDLVWSITGPNGYAANSRNSVISNSLTAEMFGTYEISYVSPNGCKLEKTFVLLEESGCETLAFNLNSREHPVELYPNPANDFLTITNQSGRPLMLDVVDISGSVKKKQVKIETGEKIISLSDLPDGMYVFIFSDDHKDIIIGSVLKR